MPDPAPTRLVVARHGQAAYVETWFSDEGGSLTDEGRAQAARLAASLAHEDVAHVVTSDTSRAVQTGEIAAGQLSVTVTAVKALREVFLGDLLGSAFHVEHIDAVAHRWHDGDLDARFPGGESGHDVVDRHRRTLDELGRSHPGATVLVVGHQTALGIALPSTADGSAAGVDRPWARDHPLANTGTAVLEGTPGAWRITRWGDPPALEA